MLSIAEIARRDGVSKPTVSVAVKRLIERHGLIVERDGQGRVALVNVAEYDHLRSRHDDLSKAQAPTRRGAVLPMAAVPTVDPDAPVYTVEQARNMAYRAELARLDLEERQGKIVSVDVVRAAARRAGEEIVRVLERLPQAADELAVALTKEGSHGVRLALKRIGLSIRHDIAAALTEATSEALRGAPKDGAPGDDPQRED